MSTPRIPVEQRFWDKVDKSGACWTWTAARSYQGYGLIGVRRAGVKMMDRAHRVSWEMHFGPIPDGLFVCHHCDNPPCVRPDHLFLGTAVSNGRDMQRKGRGRGGVSGENNCSVKYPKVGERNGRAKLTAADVAAIRARYATGTETLRSLAAEFGIHNGTIGRIVKGERWRTSATKN